MASEKHQKERGVFQKGREGQGKKQWRTALCTATAAVQSLHSLSPIRFHFMSPVGEWDRRCRTFRFLSCVRLGWARVGRCYCRAKFRGAQPIKGPIGGNTINKSYCASGFRGGKSVRGQPSTSMSASLAHKRNKCEMIYMSQLVRMYSNAEIREAADTLSDKFDVSATPLIPIIGR